ANAALLEVVADRIGIIGLVGDEGVWRALRQIDQRVVAFTVRRFAGREVEGDRAASGITETMNFTGEPAPRAAKSSLMNPPFPPAGRDTGSNRIAADVVMPALGHRLAERDGHALPHTAGAPAPEAPVN